MMFPRVSAGMIVIDAIKLYARNFSRFIAFPLIFGTLAALGQMLLFEPMSEPFGTLMQNMSSESAPAVAVDHLRLLLRDLADVMPWPVLWLVYLVTVGLLLTAFATGGMTHATMKIISNDPPPPNPTQSIYAEVKQAPKWFVTALLQNTVLLLLIFLPSLATGFLALISAGFIPFGLIAVLFIIVTANAALAMFYPIVLCEEKGLRRAVGRVWQLFRRRPGLVIVMGIWLIMLQTSATALGGLFNGGLPVRLAISALIAPISVIAVYKMYNELKQGVGDGDARDLRGV